MVAVATEAGVHWVSTDVNHFGLHCIGHVVFVPHARTNNKQVSDFKGRGLSNVESAYQSMALTAIGVDDICIQSNVESGRY